ncbi:8570_t:CDS:2, partial [Racocetra persica]
CLTVASANILDAGYSNHEFSIANIPLCIPHCMLSVFVTRTPQKVNDFIYFGKECLEYNAITRSNIKLDNVYLISGFIKFSTFSNLMIEATNIDYIRKNMNSNIFESFSSLPSTRSIIDIIANNIESATTSTQKQDHY